MFQVYLPQDPRLQDEFLPPISQSVFLSQRCSVADKNRGLQFFNLKLDLSKALKTENFGQFSAQNEPSFVRNNGLLPTTKVPNEIFFFHRQVRVQIFAWKAVRPILREIAITYDSLRKSN